MKSLASMLKSLVLEPTSMGIGAQKDLGGHQTFARKITLHFAQKVIGFSVQIKVISKKKVFTEMETV